MLITVSGPVGSGKSTIGTALADRLSEQGAKVELVNFQKLPCFRFLYREDVTSTKNRRRFGNAATTIRRENYSRTRLTLMGTCLHVGRILSFRAWRVLSGADVPLVLNRYFYDSLSHYDLDGAVARTCLRIIRSVMPRPDLAVVLETDLDTLTARRPDYARAYLETATDAYRSLPSHFPELVAVASSAGVADELLDRFRAES